LRLRSIMSVAGFIIELSTKGRQMSYNYNSSIGWISEDGSYSQGNELITFDGDLLTDKQWEILSCLPDSERIIYAIAVIDGQDVSEWEDEYDDIL
ncbi:hypothetical protein UFOVP108_126, partial [uncultured Caudovirales phage]